jgi:hypothetical protein
MASSEIGAEFVRVWPTATDIVLNKMLAYGAKPEDRETLTRIETPTPPPP